VVLTSSAVTANDNLSNPLVHFIFIPARKLPTAPFVVSVAHGSSESATAKEHGKLLVCCVQRQHLSLNFRTLA
jgi:hypothetical protein